MLPRVYTYVQEGRIPYGPYACVRSQRRPISGQYCAKTRVICSWRSVLCVKRRRSQIYSATTPIVPAVRIPYLFMSNSAEKSQPKEVVDVRVCRRHTSHCMGYHAKTNLTSHAIPLLQHSMDELKTGDRSTNIDAAKARPTEIRYQQVNSHPRERSPGSGFWADEQMRAVSGIQIVNFTPASIDQPWYPVSRRICYGCDCSF